MANKTGDCSVLEPPEKELNVDELREKLVALNSFVVL
jgi:hypothetical protein